MKRVRCLDASNSMLTNGKVYEVEEQHHQCEELFYYVVVNGCKTGGWGAWRFIPFITYKDILNEIQ